MQILVYGSNGWIGSQFIDILKGNDIDFFTGRSRVDDEKDLIKEIDEIKPTHVISFIGRTHGKIGNKVYTTIDYLEKEGKLFENVRDNLFSPLLLADICSKKSIHYTYLGTGCIFKFDETHPFGEEENGFTEDSLPNFFGSSYSVVKGFTDRLMHLYKDSVLNLRIRMPITGEKNGRNFITKITNYKRVCSIPNSMTVLDDILPILADCLENNITGTLNAVNPGTIDHSTILNLYTKYQNPDHTWEEITNNTLVNNYVKASRSNNYLETKKIEHLSPTIPNIYDSIKNILKNNKFKSRFN
jgi:3,5-epimerase/4-reductase